MTKNKKNTKMGKTKSREEVVDKKPAKGGAETPESQGDLESKFDIEGDVKKEKKIVYKEKSTFSLDKLRKDLGTLETEYKPTSWIPMSIAFQEVTQLPGVPQGCMTMVFGHSDTSKSTMGLELIANCIKVGVVPIVINTEKKWNWEHVRGFGISEKDIIYNDSCDHVEDVAFFIKDILKRQQDGEINKDIMFIWDSIGNSISKAELDADESGDNAAMMATAKVINQQFFRIIEKRISATKRANFPFFASLFTITHAYISGQTLVYYGGEGIFKGSSLVFRTGGVISKASDIFATKQGVDVAFAKKTQLVTVKNHITNIKTKGTIICVHNGYIKDSPESLAEYKKQYRDDWDIKFTKDWEKYNKDSK